MVAKIACMTRHLSVPALDLAQSASMCIQVNLRLESAAKTELPNVRQACASSPRPRQSRLSIWVLTCATVKQMSVIPLWTTCGQARLWEIGDPLRNEPLFARWQDPPITPIGGRRPGRRGLAHGQRRSDGISWSGLPAILKETKPWPWKAHDTTA